MKNQFVSALKSVLWVCSLSFFVGCASVSYNANKGHLAYEVEDYLAAAEFFEEQAAEPGTNQVLYLLDAGMSRFRAKEYEKAIKLFLQAEELAEIKDYTSISEEVGTLLSSDNIRGYKGEDFEKVLINVYLALSFAALGDHEGAQVEARKINLLLEKMITDGKRNYKESALARYMAGMLWEFDKDYDNAYISYKKAYEIDPEFPGVVSSLITLARWTGRKNELSKWTKKYPDEKYRQSKNKSDTWVFIYESGEAPLKMHRGEDPTLPYIPITRNNEKGFKITSAGKDYVCTNSVLNIARTSREYLEDRIGRMKLKKIGGTVTKAAAGVAVAKLTDSEDAGIWTFLLLSMLDQADLRSWRTLPAELFMCRFDNFHHAGKIQFKTLGDGGVILREKEVAIDESRQKSPRFMILN